MMLGTDAKGRMQREGREGDMKRCKGEERRVVGCEGRRGMGT